MSLSEFFWKVSRRILLASRAVRIIGLSEKGRLTQFVERIEPHVRMKRLSTKWLPPWLIAVNPVQAPNGALAEYFRRSIFLVDRESAPKFLSRLLRNLSLTPRDWSREFVGGRSNRWQGAWDLPPSGRRSSLDERLTSALLDELGVSSSTPIVLLSTRDSRYYEELRRDNSINRTGRETLLDTMIRNPNIDSYLPACQYLLSLGYRVVRIGTKAMPLGPEWDGVAVDYANRCRTETGDLLLARRAEFLLNGASGAWALVALFGKPALNLNCYWPFRSGSVDSRSLFAHQLQLQIGTNSLRSFGEMAKSEGKFTYQEELREADISLVKHTDEEIREMTREFVCRLQGSDPDNRDDVARRQRFDEVTRAARPAIERGRVSSAFLRRYEQLLE